MIDITMFNKMGGIAQGRLTGVADPSSLVRPSAVPPYRSPTARVEALLEQNIAATLAAGMIAAGGKPVTAEEAVQVWRGVREAMSLS